MVFGIPTGPWPWLLTLLLLLLPLMRLVPPKAECMEESAFEMALLLDTAEKGEVFEDEEEEEEAEETPKGRMCVVGTKGRPLLKLVRLLLLLL